MDLVSWEPSVEHPPSAPQGGVRPDRHGYLGLHYLIWTTEEGTESSIYRPPEQAALVPRFLDLLEDLIAEASGDLRLISDEDWPDGIDTLDVACRPGAVALDSGLGRGALSEVRRVSVSALLEAMSADVGSRQAHLPR